MRTRHRSTGIGANGDATIVARGLVRHFGDVRAVDGIDLDVAAGEIYGFLGPNGAGKTTLTRMLCTLLRPTAGSATVAGFDIGRDAGRVRLSIGVTLQEGALDDKLTGRELLRLQGRFYGLSRSEVERRIGEVSPILDVAAIDRRIGTYSGGMKRRLDVAASLIHNPRILFLDEPTTGLDPVSRAAVWEQVARLRSEFGMTIFLTTQYLEEADALADRVGIIDQGHLRAEGPPEELKRQIGADVIVVRLADDGLAADGIDGAGEIDAAGGPDGAGAASRTGGIDATGAASGIDDGDGTSTASGTGGGDGTSAATGTRGGDGTSAATGTRGGDGTSAATGTRGGDGTSAATGPGRGDGTGAATGSGRGDGGAARSVARALAVLAEVPGASHVEAHGAEVTVASEDGAAVISPVAVALAEADLSVLDISLRRPTLDDVFLDLTGRHIVVDDEPHDLQTG